MGGYANRETSTNIEDYLERIQELISRKGYARVSDIASELNFTRPSVTNMVQRLASLGFVKYAKYRGISLTLGHWRLVRECLPEKVLQLYDLATDPGEIRDLAKEQPDHASEMLAELRGMVGSNVCRALHLAIRDKDPAEGLDQKTIEGLKALGYLN